MPSKKVIRELVGKNCRTYLLCALKRPHKYKEFLPTEQSRTLLRESGYCCGFTLQSKAGYDPLGYDQLSGCNSEAIPVTPCHFTNEKSEYDQPTLNKRLKQRDLH